jgi:hypothetical protein
MSLSSIDKLIRGMHVIKQDHEGDASDEELDAGSSPTNCRNIATDSIRGDSLMATTDIAGRKRRAVTVTECVAELRCTLGILGSIVVGLRDEGGCSHSFFGASFYCCANRDCPRTGAQYKIYTHLYAV